MEVVTYSRVAYWTFFSLKRLHSTIIIYKDMLQLSLCLSYRDNISPQKMLISSESQSSTSGNPHPMRPVSLLCRRDIDDLQAFFFECLLRLPCPTKSTDATNPSYFTVRAQEGKCDSRVQMSATGLEGSFTFSSFSLSLSR